MDAWHQSYDKVRIVEGEGGARELHFRLLNGAVPLDLTGKIVTLFLETPAKTKLFLPAEVPGVTATDGIALIVLPPDATAVSGLTKSGVVRVADKEGSVLKFPLPEIYIIHADEEGAIEASDNFQALDLALGRIDQSVEQASQAVEEAQQAVSDANIAKETANTAAQNADAKAKLANDAAAAANTAKDGADKAKTDAEAAAIQADDAAAKATAAAKEADEMAQAAGAATGDAITATQAASAAAILANEKAELAQDAAEKVDQSISEAQTATADARTATVACTSATEESREQTALAGTAAISADLAAGRANTAAEGCEGILADVNAAVEEVVETQIAAQKGTVGGLAAYDDVEEKFSSVLTYTPTSDPPLPPLPIDADLLGGEKPEYYASAAGLGGKADEQWMPIDWKTVNDPPSAYPNESTTKFWSNERFGLLATNSGLVQTTKFNENVGLQFVSSYSQTEVVYRVIVAHENRWSNWTPLATATPPQEYDLPLAEGYTKIYATNQCNYSKDQFGRVYGKGTVKSGVPFGINIHFANLPMGFRPAIGTNVESSAMFSVAPSVTFYSGRVFVDSAGMVFAATASSYGATELVFEFSFLAAPTTTQSSQVRMSMSKTRSAALPIEPIVKCMCVVDAAGNYVEFVLVTISQDDEGMLCTVHYYEFQSGERLVDADHPNMRDFAGADGFITPRWNGTEWIEAATPDEVTAWELEHPAPPASTPTLEERNRADIDYLLIMGGLANELV